MESSESTVRNEISREPGPSGSGGLGGMVDLTKGDHLFHEGDYPGAMYLIRKGKIRVYRRENGVEIDLETLDENQIIGELSFLDGSLRSASAQALVDSTLVKISGPAFTKTLDGLPDWLKILMRTLCLRLRNTNSKVVAPPK
jgi:CRP/FNR family cyclic AMP-dependent transcriptional regulator